MKASARGGGLALRSKEVLEQLPQPVLVTNGAGQILKANEAARRVFGAGIRPGRAMDALDVEFFDGQGRPLTFPSISAANQAIDVKGLEVHAILPDGTSLEFLVNAAPLADEGGRPVAGVAVLQDVTALRERSKRRDLFFSVAAHELRTPLANLKGWGQFTAMKLGRLPEAAEALKYVKRLNAQIARFERLAEELLDEGQMDFTNLPLAVSGTDARKLTQEVVRELPEPYAALVHVSRGEPLLVKADAGRLQRVLLNLITNALKYGGSQPVRVLLLGGETRALIAVADKGVGIPTEDLPHIFEPFYRARNATEAGGFGLGLYTSKSIVEQHGGTMRVRGRRAGGTIFAFDLPVAVPVSSPLP